MKPPKNKKSKPWTPKRLIALALLVVAVILLVPETANKKIGKNLPRVAKKVAITMWTTDPTERYILDKASTTQISSNHFPVAIYEIRDGKQYFGACGVCYLDPGNRKYRLFTVGHVFFKRESPTSFILRRLTPCESEPSWCISSIIRIGKQWGSNIDLAECEVKPVTFPLPIVPCEVVYNPGDLLSVSVHTFDEVQSSGSTNFSRRVITSLLTGEQVTLCGVAIEEKNNSWHYIANYKFVQGESGSAFKDDTDSLYFVTGGVEKEVDPKVMKELGLTTSTPGYILGPLKPEKGK